MWFAVREVLHGSHKVAGYQILVKHLSCQLAKHLSLVLSNTGDKRNTSVAKTHWLRSRNSEAVGYQSIGYQAAAISQTHTTLVVQPIILFGRGFQSLTSSELNL